MLVSIHIKKYNAFQTPKNQTKFTQLKAPMAHKTFSQEQFIFKHLVRSSSRGINHSTKIIMSILILMFLFPAYSLTGQMLYYVAKNLFQVVEQHNTLIKSWPFVLCCVYMCHVVFTSHLTT